jgi:hypothetical protein
MFGHGRENVQRQSVGGREVATHKVNLAVHQSGDECDVSAESLAITSLACWRLHAANASASFGRSLRLPQRNFATSNRPEKPRSSRATI